MSGSRGGGGSADRGRGGRSGVVRGDGGGGESGGAPGWRGGTRIVFDADRSDRAAAAHARPAAAAAPPGDAPCLEFESRFESGNLRQARRV